MKKVKQIPLNDSLEGPLSDSHDFQSKGHIGKQIQYHERKKQR